MKMNKKAAEFKTFFVWIVILLIIALLIFAIFFTRIDKGLEIFKTLFS
tara:strand:- start:60 stop:203 length:144 start_codon:yes stop_codon:yes gene_type:complete